MSSPESSLTSNIRSRLVWSSNTRSAGHFPYIIKTGDTAAYNDTFLPKIMRFLRDGTTNLYLDRTLSNYNTAVVAPKQPHTIQPAANVVKPTTKATTTVTPKEPCPNCQKPYCIGAGMKAHRRTCDTKYSTNNVSTIATLPSTTLS